MSQRPVIASANCRQSIRAGSWGRGFYSKQVASFHDRQQSPRPGARSVAAAGSSLPAEVRRHDLVGQPRSRRDRCEWRTTPADEPDGRSTFDAATRDLDDVNCEPVVTASPCPAMTW